MGTQLAVTTIPAALVRSINKNFSLMQKAKLNAVVYYIKIGEDLIKAKEKVPHGQWEEALNRNFGLRFGTTQQASKYMRIAQNRSLVLEIFEQSEQPLTIEQLNTAIANADPKQIEAAKLNDVHVTNNSGNNEWYTPADYIEAARQVMGEIDLDPASSLEANAVVGASRIYTIEEDGLSRCWTGRVWMNPPYGTDLIGKFTHKIALHYERGDIEQAIVLVNNATETAWFVRLCETASAVVFPTGRIRYWRPGSASNAPLQGQAFLYFGPGVEQFVSVFSRFGVALRVLTG